MPAIGDLEFCDGAETGGLDMLAATVGSPSVVGSIASPAGRSGAFHYRCPPGAAAANMQFAIRWGTTDCEPNTGGIAPGFYAVGFAIRVADNRPGARRRLASMYNTGLTDAIVVYLATDGDLELEDGASTILATATDPLTNNTWHYVEIAWETVSSSGSWEYRIDGEQIGTGSAGAFIIDPYRLALQGMLTGEGNVDYDDIYGISRNGTLVGNLLGPSEVFAYQDTHAGAQTSDWTHADWNDSLDTNSWGNAGQTPLVSATFCVFATSAVGGVIDFDTGTNANGHASGPEGGIYTVTGTLQGALYVGIYQRGNGASTSHSMAHTNSSATKSATPSNTVMGTLSSGTDSLRARAWDVVPAGAYFSMGARTDGARDLEIREQWAFLLHTPAAAASLPPVRSGRAYSRRR